MLHLHTYEVLWRKKNVFWLAVKIFILWQIGILVSRQTKETNQNISIKKTSSLLKFQNPRRYFLHEKL